MNCLENKEIDENSGIQYLKIHIVLLFLLFNVCLGFSYKFLQFQDGSILFLSIVFSSENIFLLVFLTAGFLLS